MGLPNAVSSDAAAGEQWRDLDAATSPGELLAFLDAFASLPPIAAASGVHSRCLMHGPDNGCLTPDAGRARTPLL